MPKRIHCVPHVVYLLYDAANVLLYVGISCEIERRLAHHSYKSVWWREVVTVKLHHTSDRVSALDLERRWIAELKPRHNVLCSGKRRDGKPVSGKKWPR